MIFAAKSPLSHRLFTTPTAMGLLCAVASLVLAACGGGKGGGNDAGRDSATDGRIPGDGAREDATLNPDGSVFQDPCDNAFALPALNLVPVTSATFDTPVYVTQAPNSDDTLWVVERAGVIKLVRNGNVLGTPFLDITSKVYTPGDGGNEKGLLGLAFHPDYPTDPRFYVFYNPKNTTDSVVAEYKVSGNADVAGTTEVARLMEFDDDASPNHVGGMLAFGPDGKLYVGVGDGGGGDDQHGDYGNGLNKNSNNGKIHRLDVDNDDGDYVAAGNPFENGGGIATIWAYGLRNPWRFSFDRITGDLFIGDVGQDTWEEVDRIPEGEGGLNFGWRAFEGFNVFDNDPDTQALATNATDPVLAVAHGDGDNQLLREATSITGGYVYRGSAIPELRGAYLFADEGKDDVAMFRWCDGAAKDKQRIDDLSRRSDLGIDNISSFGQDNAGELYMAGYSSGKVVKIVRGE